MRWRENGSQCYIGELRKLNVPGERGKNISSDKMIVFFSELDYTILHYFT